MGKAVNSMNVVKTGIIGIGNMGSAHFHSILAGKIPGMTVTAVCDIDPEKRSAVKAQAPELAVLEDYTELLKSSDTDAVIIAVPHPLHAKIAIDAFHAGKHVLVEKPMDITVSAAERLCAAAKESGKIFGIMLNQRTNPLFREARRIVQNGELGELKRSVWIITNWYRTQSYYSSGGWRATWKGEGGGVLLNQAPHNLDLWQWICGRPTAVTAFCNEGKFHPIEVEDEATLYAEYENGATGVFITSTGDCPGTNRLEITGTRGKMVLENGLLKLWKLKEDERHICRYSTEGFVHPETEYSEQAAGKESGHAGILQNFTRAILYGETLLAPGYDGINELMISNAAYLSQWTGNQRIALPFDTAEFDRQLAEKQKDSTCHSGVRGPSDHLSYLPKWQVRW